MNFWVEFGGIWWTGVKGILEGSELRLAVGVSGDQRWFGWWNSQGMVKGTGCVMGEVGGAIGRKMGV